MAKDLYIQLEALKMEKPHLLIIIDMDALHSKLPDV